MADARFEVALTEREGGYGSRGSDAVEFLIAPNPGLPFGPLREVASGGELSRVMLALLSAAHGGTAARQGAKEDRSDRVAPAMGRCWSSTRSTPASAGTRPVRSAPTCANWRRDARSSASRTCRRWRRWRTGTSRSSRTDRRHPRVTTVAALDGDAVVGELVRMLGADEDRSRRAGTRA